MVIFTLHSENATEVKYEYYPEGKKDNKPGIIIIDIIKMQIKEIIPVENDFYVKHTAKVREICRLTGFYDEFQFMKIFKAKYGMTVKEYHRKHKSNM